MRILVGAALSVIAVAAACAPEIETLPVSQALAPAEARTEQVGDTYVYAEPGSNVEEISRTLSITDGVASGVNETTGCAYSYRTGEFAPELSWDNCDGYTGRNEIASAEGAMFPLQVGATAKWTGTGIGSKGASDTWAMWRNCTVKDTARVTVPAGTFDTYHVNCTGHSRTRDFWYAPDIGVTVIWRSRHNKRGDVNVRELVRFEPGSI